MSSGPRSIRPGARAALVVGASIIVLIPAVVAAIAITRPQWYPTGDMAQAELHVRGFWSHPPLVGAAGRIQSSAGVQGSHPGPLLWLAMWPLYTLGGATSTALVASVVVVHLATAVLALWLALRRGGIALALALTVVLALIVKAGGPDQFTEPWNPWMGLLPFLVLLLACWSYLDGDSWAVVLAVAAGTYCVQAHTGYLVIVLGLLAFVVVVVVVRAIRDGGRRDATAATDRRPIVTALAWIGAAAVAGVVLWIPPLLDQFGRDPGNMSILRDNFTHPDSPYLRLRQVVEIAVVQFDLLGPWLFGPGRGDADWLAWLGFLAFVVLWASAVATAWRRHAASELRLHAVLAVAAGLAVVSISRIFGLYLEYTVRWVWVLVGTIVAASAVSLWRAVPRPIAARRGLAVAGAAIVGVTVVIGAVQFADRAGPTGAIDSRIVGGLATPVADALDPATRYVVRWWDPTVLGATGFGLLLELERRGYDVGVDKPFAAAALPHRVLPEEQAGGVLYVVTGTPAIERARTLPGVTELASFDVRSPAQQARSDELRAELEAALAAGGHADQIALLDAPYGQAQLLFANPPLPADQAALLSDYVALRQPTAVFEAAPFTPVLPLG